jgi:transcriptional regulator with XRE-family HTH domain
MNNIQAIRQKTFGDTIRLIRTSQQLAQGDLAFLAGVNQEDIDRIEQGIPVELEIKLKILKVLYAKSQG